MTFLVANIRKNLLRIAASPWSLAIWIGVPLLVGALLSGVMGGSGGATPKMHLLLTDNDQSVRFRDCDLLRHLFETVVARCIDEGLVGGETFAADANIIRADANKQYSAAKSDWDVARIDPAAAPRAVQEYLETLDDAAFGATSEVAPKFTSFSDPARQWTGALKGPAFFAYSTNYLIDTENAIMSCRNNWWRRVD